MKITPILSLSPRLKVLEGDVRKFTAKRSPIDRKTNALEPFIHLDGILAHALADDLERNLIVGERAADDTREGGHGFIPGEFISGEVETLAGEASGLLKDANSDRPDIMDGNLRVGPS